MVTGYTEFPRNSFQISRPILPSFLLAHASGITAKSYAVLSPCLRRNALMFGPNPQTSSIGMRGRNSWILCPGTEVSPLGLWCFEASLPNPFDGLRPTDTVISSSSSIAFFIWRAMSMYDAWNTRRRPVRSANPSSIELSSTIGV